MPDWKEARITVGVIGAGNAGQAMIRALAAHFPLAVHDRDESRCDAVSGIAGDGVSIARSAADLAAKVDVVILSLPTPAASLAVVQEFKGAIEPGATVIETSTVSPEHVEALHDLLSPQGARVIDAAIVGGVAALAEGKGAFLLGSAQGKGGVAEEVIGKIAGEVFFLGGRGRGMAAKVVVNAVAHSVYVILVEAGAIAAAQGIEMATLQRLLERESGLMRPLTHRFGERLQAHDFEGGMSTANACKDSQLALDAATALGVPLFGISATHKVYELAKQEGLAALDYASIGQLWERWLDIDFTGGEQESNA